MIIATTVIICNSQKVDFSHLQTVTHEDVGFDDLGGARVHTTISGKQTLLLFDVGMVIIMFCFVLILITDFILDRARFKIILQVDLFHSKPLDCLLLVFRAYFLI